MLNKRGDINWVLISLILGVIVLVALGLGFGLGWDKLLPWLSPGNNVDTVLGQCQAACATNSAYGFCTQIRPLKANDLPGGEREVKNTCYFFSTTGGADYAKYGISQCPSINCP